MQLNGVWTEKKEVPIDIEYGLKIVFITIILFLSLNVPRFARAHACYIGCMHYNSTMVVHDIECMLYRNSANIVHVALNFLQCHK